MKELTLFYLASCPHCVRAQKYMQELQDEDPRYASIPIKRVEERQEKSLADSYDYYYVPCYYISSTKLHEGTIDKDGVRAIFEEALQS